MTSKQDAVINWGWVGVHGGGGGGPAYAYRGVGRPRPNDSEVSVTGQDVVHPPDQTENRCSVWRPPTKLLSFVK